MAGTAVEAGARKAAAELKCPKGTRNVSGELAR
jgi:hypothetical protein